MESLKLWLAISAGLNLALLAGLFSNADILRHYIRDRNYWKGECDRKEELLKQKQEQFLKIVEELDDLKLETWNAGLWHRGKDL